MACKGDICIYFDHINFRYILRTKYKTDRTFAKRMGVHANTITAWKKGTRKPTWKHVVQMAAVFCIPSRELIHRQYQVILDKWEDHLMDYLHAPPEVKHQTKTEVKVGDGDGGMESSSKTITKRELKLTERGAIDITEKLGIFEGIRKSALDDIDERLDDMIP